MTMELSSSTDDGSGEDSNAKKSASSGVKKDGSLMRNMPADKRRTMTAATRELREALYVHHAFPDEGKRLDFAVDAWEHAYMSSPWHAGRCLLFWHQLHPFTCNTRSSPPPN